MGIKTVSTSLILIALLTGCTEDTEFTIISMNELPENFNLCFSDELGDCELYNDGSFVDEKTITYNTCNATSVVRIKAMGDGIDEFTRLSFYLDGASFYGDDLDDGVCSREDIFCYCPTTNDNIDKEINITATVLDRNSYDLTLFIKKREDIIENYDFAAEVIFISDYKCNNVQCLQPHLNIFNFNKSIWNEEYNKLDENLEAFMPVIFSEGETKSFGTRDYLFECSSDLFMYEGRENGWCVAVEDWFCGHSDQDYDYLMTYETESNPDRGFLRVTFQPISDFGAKNYNIIKLIFDTDEPRALKYEINQDISGNWINYKYGEIEARQYNQEEDGRYSYEYMLPAGNVLFKNKTAEVLFSIESIGE